MCWTQRVKGHPWEQQQQQIGMVNVPSPFWLLIKLWRVSMYEIIAPNQAYSTLLGLNVQYKQALGWVSIRHPNMQKVSQILKSRALQKAMCGSSQAENEYEMHQVEHMQGFINFARNEMASISNIWAQDKESGEIGFLPGSAAALHAKTLSAPFISLCLSFPICLLQVCKSKLLHAFFLKKEHWKENQMRETESGKVNPSSISQPLLCLSKNHGRGRSKRNDEGWKKGVSDKSAVTTVPP